MKKFISVALILGLSISMVGCGSQTSEEIKETTNEGTEVSDVVEETPDEDTSKLTYLAWNTGTEEDSSIERVMINIFEEAHPGLEVEILSVPEGSNYEEYLATLAASGQMPDVFMLASVSEAILNGWAADVSEYALDDEDYKIVNPATTEGGQVSGKVYGIPKEMHYMGMYINNDLFEVNNIEPLKYGYTMEEMIHSIEKNTTSTTKGVDNFSAEAWYAMTIEPSYDMYAYDGEKFNIDTESYAEGIAYAQKVVQNNWSMANTSPLEFFGTEGWAWGEIGGIALQYDATWNLTNLSNTADFSYDFIGLPGGHTVLVNDYIFVGDSSEQKELAYELAKWVGYGVEGILTRLEICESSDAYTFNAVPLITVNDEINEKFLSLVQDFPEFIKAYETLGAQPELLHVEGYKEIPGFAAAIFHTDTGVQGTNGDGTAYSMTHEQLRKAIISGEYNLADYTTKLNEIANLEFNTAKEKLEAAVN